LFGKKTNARLDERAALQLARNGVRASLKVTLVPSTTRSYTLCTSLSSFNKNSELILCPSILPEENNELLATCKYPLLFRDKWEEKILLKSRDNVSVINKIVIFL